MPERGDLHRYGDAVTVDLPEDVIQVSTGPTHACAVAASGLAYCWGSNGRGELGGGSAGGESATPVLVDLNPVETISAGTNATGAVTDDGRVFMWGAGTGAGLQAAAVLDTPAPHAALENWSSDPPGPPLEGAVEVVVAAAHACARLANGSVMCWGDDDFLLAPGLIGDGPGSAPPAQMSQARDLLAADLCAASQHSCAVTADGDVSCWGGNARGQLGQPDTSPRDQPTLVPDLPEGGFLAVECGEEHTCARRDDGSVWCWGSNETGEAGQGNTVNPAFPGIAAIAACPKAGHIPQPVGGAPCVSRQRRAALFIATGGRSRSGARRGPS